MTSRRFEEIVNDLDDFLIDMDELKELPEGPDDESLDRIEDVFIDTADVDEGADSEI